MSQLAHLENSINGGLEQLLCVEAGTIFSNFRAVGTIAAHLENSIKGDLEWVLYVM